MSIEAITLKELCRGVSKRFADLARLADEIQQTQKEPEA